MTPPPLGDVIPDALKNMFPKVEIGIRSIIKVKVAEFTEIDYPKWVIITSISECGNFYGCVPINTDSPFNNDYATISKVDHNFLEYDSCICCSTLVELDINQTKAFIEQNQNKEFGKVSEEKHAQMISILKNSKTVKRKLKKSHKLFY